MDLKKMSVAELKQLETELDEDLQELNLELETIRTAKQKPGKQDRVNKIAENFKAKSHQSDSSITNESLGESRIQRTKLNLLSTFLGLNLNEISMTTINDEDTPWFKYEVSANIEKLRFDLMFVVNQGVDFKYQETEVKNYEFRELGIRMSYSGHEAELAKMVQFYGNHPNYIGSAILNLEKYYYLYLQRGNVIKQLLERYADFLELSLDETAGSFMLRYKGKVSNVYFLTLIWSIRWRVAEMALRDSFKCRYDHDDQQFHEEVLQILERLSSTELCANLTEEDKLGYLEKIMISLKDADTRVYSATSNSSASEN